MATIQDVEFSKHDDWSMGKNKPFWRADLNGITIVTLCRTKAKCQTEVRKIFKEKRNK